jgi:hypothetical protein
MGPVAGELGATPSNATTTWATAFYEISKVAVKKVRKTMEHIELTFIIDIYIYVY